MRHSSQWIRRSLIVLVAAFSLSARAAQKEWTMLVFLNGNNNLDPYGTTNLKQMETIGSTGDINVVVQWASAASNRTKRMLVQKSTGSGVTSPTVQELPRVDMGDYRQLIDFVRWGVQNYPAKHYFIDIWNHGGGWHRWGGGMLLAPLDISIDQFTGHSINTPQLGMAMAEAAKIIGHKVDLYASDACLMAMAEVAYELSNSVEVFAGSEEEEPGRGWPYDRLLKRWSATPQATALEVGKLLTDEYTQSYIDQHDGEVTYSVLDLSKIETLAGSLKAMGSAIAKLSPSDAKTIASAAAHSLRFDYLRGNDYVDIGDFVNQTQSSRAGIIGADLLSQVASAIHNVVVSAKNTASYAKATGLSIWLPRYPSDQLSPKYEELKFERATDWSSAISNLAANPN